MNLIGVSSLVRLRVGVFTVGQITFKDASSKVIKHDNACFDNQHIFISFAFDTFVFLAPKAVDILRKVQRVMYNNVMSPMFMNVVFTNINVVNQKSLTV